MSEHTISHYLHSWNPNPPERLKYVRIDDDIRDGTQGAFGRRPSLEERKRMVDLSAGVGTGSYVLGFPAISAQEYAECQALLRHIEARGHTGLPAFLARVLRSDVEPIVALRKQTHLDVRAEMFLGTSKLRRLVEGWNFEEMLERTLEVGTFLEANGTRFGISAEDATRTPPEDLEQIIRTAVKAGASSFSLCDTVGESTPEGAAHITRFARQCLADAGKPSLELIWHGHNDKGLSVANALAAAAAGADCISGTFMGIGERAGNTPLEQVILLLYQAGNQLFHLEHLVEYCETFAALTATPILPTSPLIGRQAFATSAGTHSAAILKARKLGREFEDHVFSAVPASRLGREQDIIINATSGMINARYMLAQLGYETSDEVARDLLSFAKSRDLWLTAADVRAFLGQQGATADRSKVQ